MSDLVLQIDMPDPFIYMNWLNKFSGRIRSRMADRLHIVSEIWKYSLQLALMT
jgi:hypothetical protein